MDNTVHICSGGFCSVFSVYVTTRGLVSGSVQVDVPVLKFLAGVSSAQGGAVAPMTGTIEMVIQAQFLYLKYARTGPVHPKS